MNKTEKENVENDKNKTNKIEFQDTAKKEPIFTRSSITLIVTIFILGILDIWCYCSFLNESVGILWLCSITTAIVMGLSILFLVLRKKGWLKTNFIIMILAAIATWGYYLIDVYNIMEYITSVEKMQEALAQVGWWKYILFFALQFLQVTFIPLPAMATTIAGTLLFGPLTATLLSLAGIMLGSIVAFIIGDKCGEKVVAWIVGREQMEKYSKLLYDKGKYMFFLMMLFPLFPDDILCLVAGMTTMSYRFFLTTIILTRPIGIIMTCYLGSGQIIPFTGWGLAVWAVLIVIMIILFWCSYKYKDKIELLINKINEKIKWVFMSKKDKVFTMLKINPNIKLIENGENNIKEIKTKKSKNKKQE